MFLTVIAAWHQLSHTHLLHAQSMVRHIAQRQAKHLRVHVLRAWRASALEGRRQREEWPVLCR